LLARYIKAQIIVLLCGGVLGPIWIVAYFMLPNLLGSFGPDVSSMWQSNTSWMLWAGLLITIADVLVALWLANRNARSSTKSAALHQIGVLTTAQIQGLQETGMRINERPVVNLDLHIAGPGFEFDDRKRVTVDISKQAIVTARKLVVLVDPNTHDYEIEWQASALIAGVVPAQFAIAEDNKTYDLSGQAGPLMEIMQIYKANNLPFGGAVTCAPIRRCANRSWPWSGEPLLRGSPHRPRLAGWRHHRWLRHPSGPLPSDCRIWRRCTNPARERRGIRQQTVADHRRHLARLD
jgi:hypothetical protein